MPWHPDRHASATLKKCPMLLGTIVGRPVTAPLRPLVPHITYWSWNIKFGGVHSLLWEYDMVWEEKQPKHKLSLPPSLSPPLSPPFSFPLFFLSFSRLRSLSMSFWPFCCFLLLNPLIILPVLIGSLFLSFRPSHHVTSLSGGNGSMVC